MIAEKAGSNWLDAIRWMLSATFSSHNQKEGNQAICKINAKTLQPDNLNKPSEAVKESKRDIQNETNEQIKLKE